MSGAPASIPAVKRIGRCLICCGAAGQLTVATVLSGGGWLFVLTAPVILGLAVLGGVIVVRGGRTDG